jgi:hypothetical protein
MRDWKGEGESEEGSWALAKIVGLVAEAVGVGLVSVR